MDRHPIRPADGIGRRPSPWNLAVALAVLVAGCGGGSAPSGFTGDPCSLITTAELEAAIGAGNLARSPEPNRESSTNSGCSWTLASPDDPVGDDANLTIISPGGAADFASTRQFLEQLEGSPGPDAISGDAASSAGPSNDLLGISLQTVPGLGDDAFVGAAGTVYTIKGDTELELQLIAFDDPAALQHTIDLLKKALARLP